MTLAAIDRLVHHATIVEMNVESYRRRTALERKRGPGRPPSHATQKRSLIDAPRQSEPTKPLRATIIAAITTTPRH
nr:ATP-binding protein [Bradyrhizobium sp. 190]